MWPFGRRRAVKGPQTEGTSAGGSAMLRYGGHEFEKSEFGVLGEETIAWARQRETVYEELFGASEKVFHEVLPLVPHIDVYKFKPGYRGRDFWTLITSGMSDLPMTLPDGVSRDLSRVELVFYCDQPNDTYLNLLRVLAHFPHDNRTWLGVGHTMPNGNPPSPIFQNTPHLTTFLYMDSILRPDREIGTQLVIEGVPVNLLWIVPITAAECTLKLNKGLDAIYDLFDSVQHHHIFTGDRESYV